MEKYASYGDVIWKVPDYKKHSEDMKVEWVRINTAFAPSSLQYMGVENRIVQLESFWTIHFCDPLQELEKLKNLAKEPKPNLLVIGNVPFGKFVIKEIKSEEQKIDIYGKAIYIKAKITFEEFPEKELKVIKTYRQPRAVRRTTNIDAKKAKSSVLNKYLR